MLQGTDVSITPDPGQQHHAYCSVTETTVCPMHPGAHSSSRITQAHPLACPAGSPGAARPGAAGGGHHAAAGQEPAGQACSCGAGRAGRHHRAAAPQQHQQPEPAAAHGGVPCPGRHRCGRPGDAEPHRQPGRCEAAGGRHRGVPAEQPGVCVRACARACAVSPGTWLQLQLLARPGCLCVHRRSGCMPWHQSCLVTCNVLPVVCWLQAILQRSSWRHSAPAPHCLHHRPSLLCPCVPCRRPLCVQRCTPCLPW